MSRLLYLNKRAAPEAFQEITRALLAGGYQVSSAPARNRDGWSTRLKKEEEIWIEWFDTDTLTVSAVSEPSEALKSEIPRVLAGTTITEVRVI